MKRQCSEIADLLSEYIDDEMDPASRANLEKHLEDCPPCDEFLRELRGSIELTRKIRTERIPSEMQRRLRSFLEGKIRS